MDGSGGHSMYDGNAVFPATNAEGADGSKLPRTGHLEGIDDEGRVLFRPEGHEGAPFPVAIGLALSDEALVAAAQEGRRAVVIPTSEAAGRWVLVGLVRERLRTDAVTRAGVDAKVDGEAVRIEATERIELVCGKASIVLEADGHVTISGTYVVSASRGPNKIKGTTISLN